MQGILGFEELRDEPTPRGIVPHPLLVNTNPEENSVFCGLVLQILNFQKPVRAGQASFQLGNRGFCSCGPPGGGGDGWGDRDILFGAENFSKNAICSIFAIFGHIWPVLKIPLLGKPPPFLTATDWVGKKPQK